MITTLYKLTWQDNQTRGGMTWGPGVTHTATGNKSQDLCSDAWIHAYESPELAVLMDPIQGSFGTTARLWEARGKTAKSDGTKIGCRRLTTIREIPLPIVTTEHRVTFAILCALRVYANPAFTRWAVRWLAGTNRFYAAAADAAAYAAADAASAASSYAACALDLKQIALDAIRKSRI